MARNYIANGTFTSQTSIGTLALMGAGPNATGTYMEKSSGIICNTFGLSDSEKTSKQLSCAATWYLNNPVDGAELLWKKVTIYGRRGLDHYKVELTQETLI